jgi:hypothetical protein
LLNGVTPTGLGAGIRGTVPHRLKHLSQWSVVQEPGGILVWTSPGKRTHRTDPANPIGPPHPKQPLVVKKTRKRPAADTYLAPRQKSTRPPAPPVPESPPFQPPLADIRRSSIMGR